jgi:hypothetical protein
LSDPDKLIETMAVTRSPTRRRKSAPCQIAESFRTIESRM